MRGHRGTLALLALTVVGSGCLNGKGTGPGSIAYVRETEFRPPSPRADMATLVFVQRGSFLNRTYSMDRQQFLGQTSRASWFEVAVPPGKHTFETFAYHEDLDALGACMTFEGELLPGKVYYLLHRWSSVAARAEGTSLQAQSAGLIIDLANEGDDGVATVPGWSVDVISSVSRVSLDPWEYLKRRDRLEPATPEGQRVMNGLFERSQVAHDRGMKDFAVQVEADTTLTPEQRKDLLSMKLCNPTGVVVAPKDFLK